MSEREWQPGDVAMVKAEWRRGEVSEGAALKCSDGWERLGDSSFVRHGDVLDAHPLVVIDPEDREQVERLHLAYATTVSADRVAGLQFALREFADPKPPKPEEPTGLGAVVEDAKGLRWVRVEPDAGRGSQILAWRSRVPQAEERVVWWSDIDVVKVLSEGVTK